MSAAVAPNPPLAPPPVPPAVSTAAPAPGPTLITAEQFMEKYAGLNIDLVRGQLKEYGMPSGRHGEVCSKATRLIGNHVEDGQLGRTMSNDTHILTRRNPDTVRGVDLCYFSFSRMPPGPAPEGVCEVPPELCVEVRSPSNTWSAIFVKVGEYLSIGVTAVLVLDPDGQTASVYRDNGNQQILTVADTLTLPDVLPGFAVQVRRFFA